MADPRAELKSRLLPKMELSRDGANSKTSPRLPATNLTPQARAAQRFSIDGNIVLTGGAGVLARCTARALLEHGAQGIALVDLEGSHANEACKADVASLRADFPESKILQLYADITRPEDVEAALDKCLAEFESRRVNGLVCFAGVVGCTHALEMSTDEFRKTLEVNTTGSFICAQAAARRMRDSGAGGAIVLTASISAHRVNYPQPQVAYNVSKTGLLALKNGLAAEWARYGIRVNSVSPGYMDTVLNEGEGLKEARDVWANRNPMGRMGDPEELTGAVVLLLSRTAGSYINGADIVVDGGAIVF